MIRTFVAFDISEIHRKECVYLIKKGKMFYPKEIKWVEPENLHITFLFLGDIEESDINKVLELLDSIPQLFTEITLKNGVLNWNSISRPQTLWLEYSFDYFEFNSIRKEFIKNLKKELPYLKLDNRDFLCHLTLGRVKSKIDINKWQVYHQEVKSGYVLNEINLYQSKLTPNGPVYTSLMR